MLNPKYKFYVDGLEVLEPHYKNLTKKYARESGQMFFRTNLEGNINLFGIDYLRVKQSDLNTEHTFKIMKYNRATTNYDLYFSSIFSKTDCTFDDDKRMCTLKLTPQDDYTKVLNAYDNTYDLIQLAPELTTVGLVKRPLVQVYIAGSNTISSFLGGEYWEQEVDEVVDYGYNEETEQIEDPLVTKHYFHFHGTANEFHIYNASDSEIKGQYSGINGTWYNQNNVKIWLEGISIGTIFMGTFVAQHSDKTYMCVATFERRIILAGDYVMKNVDDETDTFTLTNTTNYHMYTRLLLDVDTLQDGTPTYDLPQDDFVSDNRNYKKCIPLVNSTIILSVKTTTTPTKYGKNDFNEYFTDNVVSSITGIKRVYPICRSVWVNSSIWYAYDINYDIFEEPLRKPYELRDCYSISAVIKTLLNEIDPTLTHEATIEYSTFLYGTSNIITGQSFSLYMTQKSNVLKGDYDQAAQKAEITLQDVCDMLRNCFRCYWFIENGKFKIEHISWFTGGRSYTSSPGVQLNLLELYSQNNGKAACYASNKLEYDKTDLNARYEFAWMDDATEPFVGQAIDVKANYVQKDKTDNVNVSLFSADVDYMLLNPNAFSLDGFALLGTTRDTSGQLIVPILKLSLTENGEPSIYEINPQNALLTWFVLQQFYMLDMPARNIEITKHIDGLSVIDVKRCMHQEVTLPLDDDPDLYKLITTEQGDGMIDEISVNIDTRQTTMTLSFIPV